MYRNNGPMHAARLRNNGMLDLSDVAVTFVEGAAAPAGAGARAGAGAGDAATAALLRLTAPRPADETERLLSLQVCSSFLVCVPAAPGPGKH